MSCHTVFILLCFTSSYFSTNPQRTSHPSSLSYYFCHFSRFSSHYFSPSCSFLCFFFFLSSPFWSLLCFLSPWPISLALAPLITVLWAWPARRPAWLPFFIIASNWIREGQGPDNMQPLISLSFTLLTYDLVTFLTWTQELMWCEYLSDGWDLSIFARANDCLTWKGALPSRAIAMLQYAVLSGSGKTRCMINKGGEQGRGAC